MNVIIRNAVVEDNHIILQLINHEILHSTAIYDYEHRTLSEQIKWFEEKNKSNFPVIVAEVDQKIIGFATYGKFRDKIGFQYTVEHSVYINEDFIGNGIGVLLMKELILIAEKNQIKSMIGVIDSKNIKSLKFHEKLGFVNSGNLKRVGYKFDQWLDITFMQLEL